MSGADDLRTAIAQAIFGRDDHRANVLCFQQANRVLAGVLSDPVRRLAILNLIGDVREGFYTDDVPEDVVTGGADDAPTTVWQAKAEPDEFPVWKHGRCFGVIPRGEATDA